MLNKFNLNKLFCIAITLSIFTLEAQDSSDESIDSMEEIITTARRIEAVSYTHLTLPTILRV